MCVCVRVYGVCVSLSVAALDSVRTSQPLKSLFSNIARMDSTSVLYAASGSARTACSTPPYTQTHTQTHTNANTGNTAATQFQNTAFSLARCDDLLLFRLFDLGGGINGSICTVCLHIIFGI